MEAAPDINRIAHMSLREITETGGETMLYQRLQHDVMSTSWTLEQQQLVLSAAQQAINVYHQGDKRDNHSYATHVLRVANRVLSPHHFNLNHDYQLVIASILHDVIENRPERLLNEEPQEDTTINHEELLRLRAVQAIANTYGREVAEYVLLISNPITDKTSSTIAERHTIYTRHIHSLFDTDSAARYIKLSDFIDNCLGLEYNPDQNLRFKLAHKYLPLLPRMVEFVLESNLEANKKDLILNELFYAHELCKGIITSKGVVQQLGISDAIQSDIDQQTRQWRKNHMPNNTVKTTL